MKINVNEIFENKLKELEEEGFVEKVINESIENSIKKAITEAFNDYSVRRKIEDKLKNEIDKSLDFLDFSGYNQFMIDKMQKLIHAAKDVDLSNKVKSMIDEFLQPQENELKLSKLMEEYREMLMDDEQYDYDDRFGFEIDTEFSYATYIYIDEKIDSGYLSRNKSKYNYKYQVQIDNKTNLIKSLRIDGDKTDKILHLGFRDNFEGKLIRAYFNKTKINIDVDEDDVDTTLYEEY